MKTTSFNRRQFVTAVSTGSLATIIASPFSSLGKTMSVDNPPTMVAADRKKIGDFSLEQLREKYKAELFNRFIPNMEKLVIDSEYGGFMCSVDLGNHKLINTNKRAWYEGRGMWVYSFLYNNFGKDPRFLEVAQKSKDFILKLEPKDDSFWVQSISREGKPLDGPGDIYGSLFVAEGLAEFAKATGERKYLEHAKKITLSAMKRYDSPDYPSRVKDGDTDMKGPRINGHWMIFLRSATQYLQQENDPDILKIADRCLDAILKHHFNPEYGLINENINHDLSRPTTDMSKFFYLGHGIETLWMVMDEAVRRKDETLFNKASEIFKRSILVATDAIYGGHFRSLDNADTHTFKVDKVAWLQEEVLIGTMMMMEHTNDDWARERFAQTFAYMQEKFTHPELAFQTSAGDRTMTTINKTRCEHYHNPRRLMLNLLSLDRMIKRNGKISDLFS